MIQLKGDLECECYLQWMEIDKKGNDWLKIIKP
jgi:hypothetical protein